MVSALLILLFDQRRDVYLVRTSDRDQAFDARSVCLSEEEEEEEEAPNVFLFLLLFRVWVSLEKHASSASSGPYSGTVLGTTVDTYARVPGYFSTSPLYLAATPPVLRQFLEACGRIPHMFCVLFPLVQDRCASASCGTKLHHASAVGFCTERGTDCRKVQNC